MSDLAIRAAYSKWPDYNRQLREVVGALTEEQLAIQPSPERWPLWATVGHAACQRVFWLCDFAGEPGEPGADGTGTPRGRTRGAVIRRVFAHDIYHAAELNETLGINGLPQIDFWD